MMEYLSDVDNWIRLLQGAGGGEPNYATTATQSLNSLRAKTRRHKSQWRWEESLTAYFVTLWILIVWGIAISKNYKIKVIKFPLMTTCCWRIFKKIVNWKHSFTHWNQLGNSISNQRTIKYWIWQPQIFSSYSSNRKWSCYHFIFYFR